MLPPFQGLHHFSNGVTRIVNLPGKERAVILRVRGAMDPVFLSDRAWKLIELSPSLIQYIGICLLGCVSRVTDKHSTAEAEILLAVRHLHQEIRQQSVVPCTPP
jgi:hypothetical protein